MIQPAWDAIQVAHGSDAGGSRHEELPGLTVWPLASIPSGVFQHITVEMNATESEARGTFMLKLWAGEVEARGVNLDGMTFL